MNVLLFLCSPRSIVQTVPRFLFAGTTGQHVGQFNPAAQSLMKSMISRLGFEPQTVLGLCVFFFEIGISWTLGTLGTGLECWWNVNFT